MRHWMLTATALLLILSGCGGGKSGEKVAKKPNTTQTADAQKKKKAKPARRRRSRARAPARFRKYQKVSDQARKDLPDAPNEDPDKSKPIGGSAGLSEEVAIERLGDAILDSVELRPTLVVWLIDASASANRLRERTVTAIGQFYSQANDKLKKKKSKNELATAVGTFGKEVRWIVDAPITDGSAVADSLTKLTADSSGQENTFAAIKAAIDKFSSYVKKRHEVMVVVVTDEAGDDSGQADETIQLAKKSSVLVYAVGVPAAFGRVSALMQNVEGGGQPQRKRRGKRSKRSSPASKTQIVQGPESRHSEFVNIPFWGNRRGVLIDAGFGPFELERICRVSGGRFIAIRRQSFENAFPATVTDQWPTSNVLVSSPTIMSRYLPNYVSESRYQKILAGNKAQMAVHRAAKLPIKNLPEPLLVFAKARSEAEFNRRLTRAQQLPAIVQPQVERLFSILRQGEADRPKLKSPRWQAAFDLALGRVLAMKVRIEGYNTLLAAMKRGKKFQNPNSTQWILQGSDSIEGNSSLTKSAARARKYLKSVVTGHPDTPWAQIAQMELETPIGWKWTEQ